MDLEERFLTVDEVADLLRVHHTTVYRLLKKGNLAAVRVGRTGNWRISAVQLEKMLHGDGLPSRKKKK